MYLFISSYHIVLNNPCNTLPGVGEALAAKLAKCGILTLQDLLFHLPYRYQDRTRITPIRDLRANDWSVIHGQVCKVETSYGKRPALNCFVEDKTGVLKLRFFHFNKQQIKRFQEVPFIRAFGEVREFSGQLTMIHPEYQLLESEQEHHVEETLTPIYSTTQGLSQTRLRQLVSKALNLHRESLTALEWMNQEQLNTYQLHSLADALAYLHNPPPEISIHALEQGAHPAMARLALDELIAQRISLLFARKQRAARVAAPLPPAPQLQTQFIHQLPFQLTPAQHRVVTEISQDLSKKIPMLRLVQGDVGSGKTVVAACAALQAIAQGYQVAFMAPTDLLSEQHAATWDKWFTPLGLEVKRLSGKTKSRERREILTALEQHQCHVVVGTHALFQHDVVFGRLGLVIIDEQHRFGVEQRLSLQQKGQIEHFTPHQLLMTATPIPRTLAMTQLAHLDLSVIDELPPGRVPVITAVVHQNKREQVVDRLKHAISQGSQAYWVCTLIEESEALQCIAATASTSYLQEQLPHAHVGLIHGRMKPQEKETTMAAFKSGALDLLVATTVIEVGVDVPNASLMIIENAERLGLSQLHQLRGRVGRGNTQAHCLLLYQHPVSAIGVERLRVLRETTDGFVIAEKDLQLRGAGEILGKRQTGYRVFKIANLNRDQALLPTVASLAKTVSTQHPLIARALIQRWLGHVEEYLQA